MMLAGILEYAMVALSGVEDVAASSASAATVLRSTGNCVSIWGERVLRCALCDRVL
jgi:hypothetical protein